MEGAAPASTTTATVVVHGAVVLEGVPSLTASRAAHVVPADARRLGPEEKVGLGQQWHRVEPPEASTSD
jgi:hypothetical protein